MWENFLYRNYKTEVHSQLIAVLLLELRVTFPPSAQNLLIMKRPRKTSLLSYPLPKSSSLFKTCLWFVFENIPADALSEAHQITKSLCGTVPLRRGLNLIPQAYICMLDFHTSFFVLIRTIQNTT